MHHVLCRARCVHDGFQIAVLLDREALNRLSSRRNAVDDLLRPARFDADDDNGCHIGVAPGADDGAKVHVKVDAKLQTAIGVRNRQGSLDVVCNSFTGCVRNIIQWQDQHVVAYTDTSVVASVALDRHF